MRKGKRSMHVSIYTQFHGRLHHKWRQAATAWLLLTGKRINTQFGAHQCKLIAKAWVLTNFTSILGSKFLQILFEDSHLLVELSSYAPRNNNNGNRHQTTCWKRTCSICEISSCFATALILPSSSFFFWRPAMPLARIFSKGPPKTLPRTISHKSVQDSK